MNGQGGTAVYDMDLTITDRPSWTAFLLHFARHHAPWRLVLLPLLALPLAAYALRLTGRAGLKSAAQRLLMGARVPRATIAEAAESFAARFAPAHERPAALAAIAADRAAGRHLILATASARFYVEPLARRWGFDTLVATDHVWDGDRLTPAIAGGNCYALNKLRKALRALPRCQRPIRAYSDHVSDLPLLLWADQPVAVSPSRALRAMAAARGWPIVAWDRARDDAGAKTAPQAGSEAPQDKSTAPTESPSPSG
jgi:HAD superfamily phosphoserine phosphatase-like hydrolase